MYRNYDGAKSTFGDTSVLASAPNPDNLAAFAAQRSADGALTVMAISKYLAGNTPITFTLANFTDGTAAQVYQLTAANRIERLADISLNAAGFSTTLPQQSITLFVIPAAGTSALNAPGKLTASVSHRTVTLHWMDQSNNETGFYVERAPIHTAKFARVGQVGANVTTFSQTVAAGMSIYRVQSFNQATGQVSPYSNQVDVRVR
jgi:hypothetical protein